MNKIIRTACIAVIGSLACALPALAATTASFSPATIKVTAGQQFNVTVTVDPQSSKNYAEKLEVDYPSDVFEASTFTLANGWTALSQPGYDSNTAGALVKTAGYAGGISSPTLFGTILFTAKKSGTGTISVGAQSSAFQTSSQTAISGVGATFTVSAGSPTTVAPTAKHAAVSAPAPTATDLAPVTTLNGQTVVASSAPTSTADLNQSSQTAAVADASSGSGSSTYWIIAVIVLLLIIAYLALKKRPANRM